MKQLNFSQKTSFLVFILGVNLMNMFCLSASQDSLCNMNTCIYLDNCQSLSDALSKALVKYQTSQDISAYQLSNRVSNSVELYNMTARYLNVFNGLSRALDDYMKTEAYRTESSYKPVERFTNQFRFNLTLVYTYTSYAADEMSWALYSREHNASSFAAVTVAATKDATHGHGYLVSDMFRTMLGGWRSGCAECRNHLLRKKRELCSNGKKLSAITGVNVTAYIAKKEQKRNLSFKNQILKGKKPKTRNLAL